MKVGDLIKRKWVVAEMGPIPSGYSAGIVIALSDPDWVVVRWVDGHGVGNSLYRPENLEVISEGR